MNLELDLKQYLDSTFLTLMDDPVIEEHSIKVLCQDVVLHKIRGVCVRPQWVKLAKNIVGCQCKVATVIGFPCVKTTLQQESQTPSIGVVPIDVKVTEIKQAIAAGCDELDIVLNTSFYSIQNENERNQRILNELTVLKEASGLTPIKLIFEADLLPKVYLPQVIEYCAQVKIEFVKNATGYVKDGNGASSELIQQITQIIEDLNSPFKPGIKASGGILNSHQAKILIGLGASILGTSQAVPILLEKPIHSHTY
jgi:deoxyribose-phosphate aldolase